MSESQPDGSWTLKDARAWLREQRVEGVRCPCCNQLAKIYKRSMLSTSARTLIAMYLETRGTDNFIHIPTLVQRRVRDKAHQGGSSTLGAYWGLIEEERERRPDGGRKGWWRLTPKGLAWVLGRTTIPHYAYTYNSRVVEVSGPPVSIRQALGTGFDYEEMMGPAMPPPDRDTFWDL